MGCWKMALMQPYKPLATVPGADHTRRFALTAAYDQQTDLHIREGICRFPDRTPFIEGPKTRNGGGHDVGDEHGHLLKRLANAAAEVVSRIRALFRQSNDMRAAINLAEIMVEARNLLAEDTLRRGVRIVLDTARGLPLLRLDRVQIQ